MSQPNFTVYPRPSKIAEKEIILENWIHLTE